MNQASRTSSGIRNEDLFHPGKFLVFVEDDEDVHFWGQFVPKWAGRLERHFKAVGGKEELQNRIAEFGRDGGVSIVAMDCDYDEILGTHPERARVARTPCYCIENVISCHCRITPFLDGLALAGHTLEAEVVEWLANYDRVVLPLFVVDVALRRRGTEFPRTPVKAQPFADGQARPHISSEKIASYTTEAGLGQAALDDAGALIAGRLPRHWFRGHFLLDAIGAFIRARANEGKGRTISVPCATLFAALSDCSRSCEHCSELMKELALRARRAVCEMTPP